MEGEKKNGKKIEREGREEKEKGGNGKETKEEDRKSRKDRKNDNTTKEQNRQLHSEYYKITIHIFLRVGFFPKLEFGLAAVDSLSPTLWHQPWSFFVRLSKLLVQ